MIPHTQIEQAELRSLIKQGKLTYGGNARLKIYGTLACSSGKRMKKENRVFFTSETEALQWGYRPCGHCMKAQYQQWKAACIEAAVTNLFPAPDSR